MMDKPLLAETHDISLLKPPLEIRRLWFTNPTVFFFVFCKVKLTSRDPSPPPVDYVRGGGGIFKDMAVHDLDMSRFLMGSEPKVLYCHWRDSEERVRSRPCTWRGL